MWSLSYDSAQWGGVCRDTFIKALDAELENSVMIGTTYEPLNHTSLYRPLGKKTHKLSEEYAKAVNPAQYDLPMCDKAFKEVSVSFYHTTLLMDGAGNQQLIDAITKIKDNLDELRTYSTVG